MTDNQFSHTIVVPTNSVIEDDGNLLYFKDLSKDSGKSISELNSMMRSILLDQHQKMLEDPSIVSADNSNDDILMMAGKELEKQVLSPEEESEDENSEEYEDFGVQDQFGIDPYDMGISDFNSELIVNTSNQAFDDFGAEATSPDSVNAEFIDFGEEPESTSDEELPTESEEPSSSGEEIEDNPFAG